ncbi:hypothetical protein Q1695_013377 [Nippostrongylus brasiliensis]|nr:hypothetical protein Q1695_013377 [Nippostrongylus brasiliensis]
MTSFRVAPVSDRAAFAVSLVCLLSAVLFISQGFSMRSSLAPTPAPLSSPTFDECFPDEFADHLVDDDLRVVLMVIDAWRLSFLTYDDSPMTFLRNSIQSGRAVAFAAAAQTPTVTMPRIQAVTSGVVPSLTSLLMNFFASEHTDDNWVNAAADEGRRIAFFGDDTWLRLFPNAFTQSDGVSSFFVSDYTEVDNNVTRHLDSVLHSDQWDVLILHYLGLDHIGHSLGGQSPQLKVKLMEMDDIARRIFQELSSHSPVLLAVIADHGMTAAGSHGGGTDAEIRVPIVLLHSRAEVIRGENISALHSAEQVDLATTLPFFVRSKIPRGSVGWSLVPQLADYWKLNSSTVFNAARQASSHLSGLTGRDSFGLDDVVESDRCQAARAFVGDVRHGLAVEEARKAQQELLKAQEQAFRWPIFVGIFLLLLGFIILFKCRLSTPSGTAEGRAGSPTRESSGYIHVEHLVFALYHLSSYATSYVEEEHDIWYYLSSTLIFCQLFSIVKGSIRNRPFSEIVLSDPRFRDGFLLWCLHRVGVGFNAHTRRRWVMNPDLLPPPIVPEFRFNNVLDNFTTDLILPELAKRAPLISTVLCVVYLLFRFRPVHRRHKCFSMYFLAVAVCYRAYLGDECGWTIYLIVGTTLLTSLRSISIAALLYLSYLVRPETQPLLAITFEMGLLTRRARFSPLFFAFLCQTVFFYTGQSSNISSIDVAVGYKCLSSYNAALVGFQMLLNFYALPLSFMFGYILHGISEADTVRLFCSVLQLRCLMLMTAILSMICLSGHLFTFSVLAPKMICEVLHAIIILIITGITVLAKYGTHLLGRCFR